MITSQNISLQLGRFCITAPLTVNLQGQNDEWIATLHPQKLTLDEWGCGATPQEALNDLENTLVAMKETLQDTSRSWSQELLDYKALLDNHVTINTTGHITW